MQERSYVSGIRGNQLFFSSLFSLLSSLFFLLFSLPVTLRRFLLAMAALAVGILVGFPLAWYVLPEPESAEEDVDRPVQVVAEPVELGASEEELQAPRPDPAVVRQINEITRQAVRVAQPSVVFIETSTEATPQDAFHRDLGPFYGRNTVGSGVIISEEGHVLTNAHVVEEGDQSRVRLVNRREFEAETIGVDRTTDLAVLRLLGYDPETADAPLPVASLGDSEALEVGDRVLAIGSPYRMQGTVTEGIVSAVGRDGILQGREFGVEDFIQTDAAINTGNSGGALVNLQGEVVGIITAIATETGGSEGYGFAIPTRLARHVAQDLIQFGEVRRGYLGVEVRAVTHDDAQELELPRIQGALVDQVIPEGAAGKIGIMPGDVILEVNGEEISAPNTFVSRLARSRPGEEITLLLWRDGEPMEATVTLMGEGSEVFQEWIAQRRESPPTPHSELSPDIPRSEALDWGIRFRELREEERDAFQVRDGVYVERVDPESAADIDGLPADVVVTEIEGQRVRSAQQAQRAMERLAQGAQPALLRVQRGDGLPAFYDLASPYVD